MENTLVALRVEKAISKQLWKCLKLLALPNGGWSYSLLLPCFLVASLMGEKAFFIISKDGVSRLDVEGHDRSC